MKTSEKLLNHNQELINDLRRKPIPLADIIPHLQKMADHITYLQEDLDATLDDLCYFQSQSWGRSE